MKLKLSLAVLALAAFAYGQDAASDVKKARDQEGCEENRPRNRESR